MQEESKEPAAGVKMTTGANSSRLDLTSLKPVLAATTNRASTKRQAVPSHKVQGFKATKKIASTNEMTP